MPILDLITALFVLVDDRLKQQGQNTVPDHSQQKLAPSELITLGMLYALKGVSQSQCHSSTAGLLPTTASSSPAYLREPTCFVA